MVNGFWEFYLRASSLISYELGHIFHNACSIDAALPKNIGGYFLSLLLLITASLSIGMVFGLFMKSPSKIEMSAQLVFLPSILLSRVMFPANKLPEALQYAERILPAAGVILSAWKIEKLYVE